MQASVRTVDEDSHRSLAAAANNSVLSQSVWNVVKGVLVYLDVVMWSGVCVACLEYAYAAERAVAAIPFLPAGIGM